MTFDFIKLKNIYIFFLKLKLKDLIFLKLRKVIFFKKIFCKIEEIDLFFY